MGDGERREAGREPLPENEHIMSVKQNIDWLSYTKILSPIAGIICFLLALLGCKKISPILASEAFRRNPSCDDEVNKRIIILIFIFIFLIAAQFVVSFICFRIIDNLRKFNLLKNRSGNSETELARSDLDRNLDERPAQYSLFEMRPNFYEPISVFNSILFPVLLTLFCYFAAIHQSNLTAIIERIVENCAA